MSSQSHAIDVFQTKVINATSRVVPMHLQIRALKLLVRAKKRVIGPPISSDCATRRPCTIRRTVPSGRSGR